MPRPAPQPSQAQKLVQVRSRRVSKGRSSHRPLKHENITLCVAKTAILHVCIMAKRVLAPAAGSQSSGTTSSRSPPCGSAPALLSYSDSFSKCTGARCVWKRINVHRGCVFTSLIETNNTHSQCSVIRPHPHFSNGENFDLHWSAC